MPYQRQMLPPEQTKALSLEIAAALEARGVTHCRVRKFRRGHWNVCLEARAHWSPVWKPLRSRKTIYVYMKRFGLLHLLRQMWPDIDFTEFERTAPGRHYSFTIRAEKPILELTT